MDLHGDMKHDESWGVNTSSIAIAEIKSSALSDTVNICGLCILESDPLQVVISLFQTGFLACLTGTSLA